MADNLGSQFGNSVQEAQLRAETMRTVREIKEAIVGAGRAGAGIVGAGAGMLGAGAYAGMQMAGPMLSGTAGFINQALGRNVGFSGSAFGDRVGGPGNLLYQAGLGGVLNQLTGGYLFQDFNKSISQTSDQMRSRARNEISLRAGEVMASTKMGLLTAGGILDDSIAYRFTKGADERVKSDLTRSLASSLEGLGINKGFAVASDVSEGLTTKIGALNKQMGYGLSQQQQRELGMLAISFAGPQSGDPDKLREKSERALEAFTKHAGNIGISAEALMKGAKALEQSGVATAEAAGEYTDAVKKFKEAGVLGAGGTDEAYAKLAVENTVANRAKGISGLQAQVATETRMRNIAAATKLMERYDLQQTGVFGTGQEATKNTVAMRERMTQQAIGGVGLAAALDDRVFDQLMAGDFGSYTGQIRGSALGRTAELRNPLLAEYAKSNPELFNQALAARLGTGALTMSALSSGNPLAKRRLRSDLANARKVLGLEGDARNMSDDQKRRVTRLALQASGITDTQTVSFLSNVFLTDPAALQNFLETGNIDKKDAARISLDEELGKAIEAQNKYEPNNKITLDKILEGATPEQLDAVRKNDKTVMHDLFAKAMGFTGMAKQITDEVVSDPEKVRAELPALKDADPVKAAAYEKVLKRYDLQMEGWKERFLAGRADDGRFFSPFANADNDFIDRYRVKSGSINLKLNPYYEHMMKESLYDSEGGSIGDGRRDRFGKLINMPTYGITQLANQIADGYRNRVGTGGKFNVMQVQATTVQITQK